MNNIKLLVSISDAVYSRKISGMHRLLRVTLQTTTARYLPWGFLPLVLYTTTYRHYDSQRVTTVYEGINQHVL